MIDRIDRASGNSGVPGGMSAERRPEAAADTYFVEQDTAYSTCACCGAGAYWLIVRPGGTALGTSYSNRLRAEELAECLTDAYRDGLAARATLAEPALPPAPDTNSLRLAAAVLATWIEEDTP